MRKTFRIAGAFILAVIAATVLGSISSTQFVLGGLTGLGVEISILDRLSTTLQDVIGISRLLGLVYGVALLLGFLVAGIANRFLPGPRQTWFTVGGAAAIVTVLLILNGIMGGMPLAGARGVTGLLGQTLAGAAAGYIFVRFAPNREETG